MRYVLLVLLVLCDVCWRRLPQAVVFAAGLLTLTGALLAWWPVSVPGGLVGLMLTGWAGLPGGDLKGAGLLGLVWGPLAMLIAFTLAVGLEAFIHRSTRGAFIAFAWLPYLGAGLLLARWVGGA